MIDVCIDNCMLYWKRDVDRTSCRFCHKPRFQKTSRKTKIPYKRMWYLPITDRLKRLYQFKHTAEAMRWHGEHNSNREIAHPSDAKAWQHFQSVYPNFASERRNVYLGLSTDGFNPFGSHGRQYSLWPVIVTPYNLPPSLCMKREFLFLTILVPGPAHPKRSIDVYLQPLIHELKMLWAEGVEVYDISARQNFIMRAVLMWTISDFSAYGMLSGWTTHGRLACPYCQDNTDAFQLKNGRKTCWFDCHRRYLPHDHPYRKSTTLFTKNKKVFDDPPPEIDGKSILTQLRDFGVESTAKCGGNGHDPVYGYGENHNWHKKSIFWKLPCVAFFAGWYNPIVEYGVRIDEFRVTSVHSRRSLANYDPFILASQADQVTYIRYPRVRNKQDPWVTVTHITPRGKLEGVSDTAAMQQSSSNAMGDLHVDGTEIDLVVDFTGVGDNQVISDSESENGEFNEDSVSSEYSSNSD
ncbi:hypothetical protein YC2023_116372 [Brassica napus]